MKPPEYKHCKITISVPGPLFRQVKEAKKEYKYFQISRICQVALKKAVKNLDYSDYDIMTA